MEDIKHYKLESHVFFGAAHRLNKSCVEHIKSILNKCENKHISWNYDDLDEKGLCPIEVVYTEWKHKIDLSNVKSVVNGVRIGERGLIVIECEDGEMSVGDIVPLTTIADLYDLCDFLDCYVEENEE